MTATGSHEYFYSLRGAQPPGEGFSLSRRAFSSILTAQYSLLGGRGVPRLTPFGVTDVGCIVFPGGPKIAPGPLHTRPLWGHPLQQERAFLKAVKSLLLLTVHSPSLPYGQTAPS